VSLKHISDEAEALSLTLRLGEKRWFEPSQSAWKVAIGVLFPGITE
jgi:hypothetical protein